MEVYILISGILFIIVILLLIYIIMKHNKEEDVQQAIVGYCKEGCNCFSNCRDSGNCCASKCGDDLGECNCDSDCLQWGNCCDECDGMRFVCERK